MNTKIILLLNFWADWAFWDNTKKNLQFCYCILLLRAQITQELKLQRNKYKIDPYLLQIFQSSTSVCLIISALCRSRKLICELEIVQKIETHQWGTGNVYLLQKAEINIVAHWKS